MKPTLFRPSRPGLVIPMPDRGNRAMPQSGAAVDVRSRYYGRLLADRDIEKVPVADQRKAGDAPARETAPAHRASKKRG